MDLKDRVRDGLDFEYLQGMEIGPLYRPFVLKSEGKLIYVDHADTETLRNKYADTTQFNVDDIVNIDAVWGPKTLHECIGENQKVDYIIASQVVEHVPDFITWLNELHSILKPKGEIRLVVPDKNFTFDYARQITTFADVLDANLRLARSPLPQNILDHFLKTREINLTEAWAGPINAE
jgi:SAM-dependent methyltransferase